MEVEFLMVSLATLVTGVQIWDALKALTSKSGAALLLQPRSVAYLPLAKPLTSHLLVKSLTSHLLVKSYVPLCPKSVVVAPRLLEQKVLQIPTAPAPKQFKGAEEGHETSTDPLKPSDLKPQ